MSTMKFQGTWVEQESRETINITGPNSSDEYILEYEFEEDTFHKKEIISLYISNKKHALLAKSERFGRADIRILNEDMIDIKNEVFVRQDSKQ